MIDGQFAYVFGVGMVAAFNPCGFAMLPAYLAYFTGVEEDRPDAFGGLMRGLGIGATMTLGFVAVFAAAGLIIEGISGTFQQHLPWVTILIGLALVALGVAYLTGREVVLRLPHLERGGQDRSFASMFVFGVSYALASLSCTIPTFLAAVSTTFRNESFLSGVTAFVVYALGMGLVITFVTVAVALARHGVVARLRSFLPYVGRVAGALLVVAGAYMAWYGWWERQVQEGNDVAAGPVSWVTDASSSVTQWVTDVGALRLALVLGGAMAVVLVLAWGWRASAPPPARRDRTEPVESASS